MMIFAYDFCGVLTSQRIPAGETVKKKKKKSSTRCFLGQDSVQHYAISSQNSLTAHCSFCMSTRHPIKVRLQRAIGGI